MTYGITAALNADQPSRRDKAAAAADAHEKKKGKGGGEKELESLGREPRSRNQALRGHPLTAKEKAGIPCIFPPKGSCKHGKQCAYSHIPKRSASPAAKGDKTG